MRKAILARSSSSPEIELENELILVFEYLIKDLTEINGSFLSALITPPCFSELEAMQNEINPLGIYSHVNGKQAKVNYEINKISDYKYILNDTLSINGEVGFSIETHDLINDLPFKFGVYKIELILDGEIIYQIIYDKYSFEEDFLIYTDVDFSLLKIVGK